MHGAYGNHDGHWHSWAARGILQWSTFLDFSPFSPFHGTGSLFLVELPWLNPAALVLGLPEPLGARHLISYLIYFFELTVSLYLLYRSFEFSRDESFIATFLYAGIFFIPLHSYFLANPWYTLVPVNAHLTAAFNIATIAVIRAGNSRRSLLLAMLFAASLFVAFTSATMIWLTFLPAYGLLWALLVLPRGERKVSNARLRVLGIGALLIAATGVPLYIAATVATSARGISNPSFLHPGTDLLSVTFWTDLLSRFDVCDPLDPLLCYRLPVGWYEMAALAGSALLVVTATGLKRTYAIAVLALLIADHLYALLSVDLILGRLHAIRSPYLMWPVLSLAAAPAVAAAGDVINWIMGQSAARMRWAWSGLSCAMAAAAVFLWLYKVAPDYPRLPGTGPLGLPPIAHVPPSRGPIVAHLERQLALKPGDRFRGYAGAFLGTVESGASYDTYIATYLPFLDKFGTTFHSVDLWYHDIPTIEEFGQWVTKQIHYFNRDLLAEPGDKLDPFDRNVLLYRLRPRLLAALGVRFVIASDYLPDPALNLLMTEVGRSAAVMHLYEIKRPNAGQFSPIHTVAAPNYAAAVALLRTDMDLEDTMVVLGDAFDRTRTLVRATSAQLFAIKDGYRVTATAPGPAVLVLPVQFSHCWRMSSSAPEPARVFRANIIQTGVLFSGSIDAELRFEFEPWTPLCRLRDGRDLATYDFH
jgi:hypothetical protein